MTAFPNIDPATRGRLAERGIDPETSYEAMLGEILQGGALVDRILADVNFLGRPVEERRLAHRDGRRRRERHEPDLERGILLVGLLPAEVEAMQGLADGETVEETALRLGYAPSTVAEWRKTAYRKVGVSGRHASTAAVTRLMRLGVVT